MENIASGSSEIKKKSGSIGIAATLSWLWGILMILSGVMFIPPALSQNQPIIFPLFLVSLGIAFCVSGYGLRRRRQFSRWLSIVISILSIAVMVVVRVKLSMVGILIGISILVIVGLNWLRFNDNNT